MPIYEYACESCGERLERLQKLGDPPLTDCPACGEPRLRRLVSAPAFHLKGSGWYVTDYARKGKEPASESGTESGAKDSAGKESGAREAGGKESATSGKGAKGGGESTATAKADSTG